MHNNNETKFNNWCNGAAVSLQHQLQQQQIQRDQIEQQQLHQDELQQFNSINNWIAQSNKTRRQLNPSNINNNNNNINMHCNNTQRLLHASQQQQSQQQFIPQPYTNYDPPHHHLQPQSPPTNHQLHQSQHQQQHHQQQQYLTQQQIVNNNENTTTTLNSCYYAQHRQQQQQQQVQVTPPQHSPYQQHQQHHHQLQSVAHLPPQAPQQQQRLVSVDGIQSGVPTLTTSTLTPTTLRSIEETFNLLTSEPINAPYQAGFIPPPCVPLSVTTNSSNNNNNNSLINNNNSNSNPLNGSSLNDFHDTDSNDSIESINATSQLNDDNSMVTTDTSSAATDSTSFQNGFNGMGNTSLTTSNLSNSTNDFSNVNIALAAKTNALLRSSTPNKANGNTSHSATPSSSRRNQGGRRPAKPSNLTPEEEEKRRIRRERNKLAAARCRKRRVDQTNELLEEVARLEKIRDGLQSDIEILNGSKRQLEQLIEAHRPTCQIIRQDLLSVSTFGGYIGQTSEAAAAVAAANAGTPVNNNATGLNTTLASTGRSDSPLDIKPLITPDTMLDIVQKIKHEPLDSMLDSNSSLDHDGPPSPKRMLLRNANPSMVPPLSLPLPNVGTLSASLAAAASASLNTPIVSTAPVSFGSLSSNNATLNTLNSLNKGTKQRPNTLPGVPRNLVQNLALNIDGKSLTDINGVSIQTPSTGMFNFDSLMDGGTGLTPVSGPLVPTCSSQIKHPLEMNTPTTPTTEPSKLVSL